MNILLSAVGRRAYLVEWFKEALRPLGGKVICTNTMADATGMIAADIAEIVPPANSPAYIPAMLTLCRRHRISLLFSLHDWEAPFIAAHREAFLEAGTLPVMPDSAIIEACLDKWQTFQTMRMLGIATPQTFETQAEAESALAAGEVQFPLIVKPRRGQGSIGVFRVNAPDELAWVCQLSQKTAGGGIPRTIQPEKPIIIQACLQGEEHVCEIVNDLSGRFVTTFVKRKMAMRAGETDIAETVFHPEIENIAQKIADWSQHPGIIAADFIADETGRTHLLEINPRFAGCYPFSHMAGADIPSACVAWRMGKAPDPRHLSVKTGVRSYKSISMMLEKEP